MLEPALLEMENKKLTLTPESFGGFIDTLFAKLSLQDLRLMAAGPKKQLDAELNKELSFSVFPLDEK